MRSRRVFSSAVVILVLAAACDTSAPPEVPFSARTPVVQPTSATGPVIGLVGTMTGTGSWRGEDAFEGADLGVHVLNSALTKDDAPYQLVTLDDGGDAGRAQTLIDRLAHSARTVGIVYAGPPDALPSEEKVLAERGIPAVICYGDLYGRSALSDHLFQVSPPYLWQARRIASYLISDRRYRRVGIVAEDSSDGRTAVLGMRRALGGYRHSELVSASYQSDAGIRGALARLQRARAQAIVVQGSPDAFGATLDRLATMGSTYRSTVAARAIAHVKGRAASAGWRPQVIGFDSAISPFLKRTIPPGTIASETYARGAHYLPVPSFAAFRSAFEDWWSDEPVGWEIRSYDATSMIGWAASHSSPGDDVASWLEKLKGQRFGALDVTFGPHDHISVEPRTVGLWAVPRPGIKVLERDSLPRWMPWVPLARGFSRDGKRTEIDPEDWRYLFTAVPGSGSVAPLLSTERWGITTSRSDPVH